MPRVIGNRKPMRDIRGGVHGDYQFWDSANANAVAEQYYLSRLSELAMSMFKWKNLPETVDSRFLEYTLFYEGAVVFFQDESLKKSQLDKQGVGLAHGVKQLCELIGEAEARPTSPLRLFSQFILLFCHSYLKFEIKLKVYPFGSPQGSGSVPHIRRFRTGRSPLDGYRCTIVVGIPLPFL